MSMCMMIIIQTNITKVIVTISQCSVTNCNYILHLGYNSRQSNYQHNGRIERRQKIDNQAMLPDRLKSIRYYWLETAFCMADRSSLETADRALRGRPLCGLSCFQYRRFCSN